MRISNHLLPLLYAALRLGTSGFAPVPAAVVLDPLPVLLALTTSRSDKPLWTGALFLPGLILGDLLAGMHPWTVAGRVAMAVVFLFARGEDGFHRKSWVWIFQFTLGTAILVDINRYYPLGFVTLVGILQGFLWWGVLAPRTGGGTLRPFWPLVFPPVALLAVHLLLPSPPLWPPPVLSQHSSNWVRFFAILLLAEPFFPHAVQVGKRILTHEKFWSLAKSQRIAKLDKV